MDRNIAVAISKCRITDISGTFQRHASVSVRTLTGSDAGGRWGAPGAYSVLYLGRPTASIIAEAYRHLVDDVEGMRPELVKPRRLVTVEVNVSRILDLRDRDSQGLVALDEDALEGPHGPCQRVGQAAHQLELHGIIAPAATALGETLALFEHHLPEQELPKIVREERWEGLPPDPRSADRGRVSFRSTDPTL